MNQGTCDDFSFPFPEDWFCYNVPELGSGSWQYDPYSCDDPGVGVDIRVAIGLKSGTSDVWIWVEVEIDPLVGAGWAIGNKDTTDNDSTDCESISEAVTMSNLAGSDGACDFSGATATVSSP